MFACDSTRGMFFIARLSIHLSGVLTALTGWYHVKLLPSWHILCTPFNLVISYKCTYVGCMRVVTCHLHFWQNDRDLLCATVVTQGGGMVTKSAQKVDPREENYLHFWQNDQDLLHATVVIRGVGNGYRVSTES